MKHSLLFVAIVLFCGCRCHPLPAPTPPDPGQADAAPADDAALPSCATACANQRRMHCKLGDPTPKGASCEDVCGNAEQSGIQSLQWDVGCLTKARACIPCAQQP